jgi:hypothetical protein
MANKRQRVENQDTPVLSPAASAAAATLSSAKEGNLLDFSGLESDTDESYIKYCMRFEPYDPLVAKELKYIEDLLKKATKKDQNFAIQYLRSKRESDPQMADYLFNAANLEIRIRESIESDHVKKYKAAATRVKNYRGNDLIQYEKMIRESDFTRKSYIHFYFLY